MIARLTMTVALLLSAENALAIYQCTNESGGKSFQDAPCATVSAPGKQNSQIIHNSSVTSLNEALLRTIYKEQVDAMLSGDLKWLCDIMDEKFSGNAKITVDRNSTVHTLKKQDTCRNHRSMFANLNEHDRKWQYKVDISTITISEDQKKAVVKSTYTFTVNQPGASSKGGGTDTWAVKDGHVYLIETKGEATTF